MAINLLDITTNNNDLTNNGGATEVTSSLPFAQSTIAVDLESTSSQYLSIADASQTGLDFSTTFTLEAWVKFESLPSSSTMVILSKYNRADTTGGYQLDVSHTGTEYRINAKVYQTADATTRDLYYVTWTPSTGVWYHLALTCNVGNASATTFEFFKDGVSLGNGTAQVSDNCTSIYNSTNAFLIGCGYESNTPAFERFFDGVIDDVRVWNDVRTATEISDNMSVELVGNESNLVAYWPFETISAAGGPPVSYRSLLGVGI